MNDILMMRLLCEAAGPLDFQMFEVGTSVQELSSTSETMWCNEESISRLFGIAVIKQAIAGLDALVHELAA